MTTYDTIQEVDDALETVVVEQHDDGIAELRLDRPRRMNALSERMLRELPQAISYLDANPPEALVLTSSGRRAFCVGLDPEIFEALEAAERPLVYVEEVVASKINSLTSALERLDTPIVGAIQGPAHGGGFEIAISSDLRIAGESTEGSQPEINHGILPAGGATQRLPDLVGEARAKEIIFTDEIFDAETLSDWGVFSQVVSDDEVEARAFELADSLTTNPRNAYATVKRAMRAHNNRRRSGFDIEWKGAIDQAPDADFSEIK